MHGWCAVIWCAVHGYVETASVVAVLHDVEQTSQDIVGLPLYKTQFKVSNFCRPPS